MVFFDRLLFRLSFDGVQPDCVPRAIVVFWLSSDGGPTSILLTDVSCGGCL